MIRGLRLRPARLVHNWPQKLGALLLAVLLWLFVSNDSTSTTQRAFFVPLNVQGLSENQVATGVPERIEVTVSGPSPRVNALRPESIDAGLDLSGADGTFEESIRVSPPQGISLVRVNPTEVGGVVESTTQKSVPVRIALVGEAAPNLELDTTVSPDSVSVRGRSSLLSEVTAATAVVQAEPGEVTVTLFPSDASGEPVSGVALDPSVATVGLVGKRILHIRTVPIDLRLPSFSPLTVQGSNLSSETLRVAGPVEALNALETIDVSVERPTTALEEGSYTFDVTPQLPEGVVALDMITLSVRLSESPLAE